MQHMSAGSREMWVVLEGSIRSIMVHLQRIDWWSVALWDVGGEFSPALLSPNLAILGAWWLGRAVP